MSEPGEFRLSAIKDDVLLLLEKYDVTPAQLTINMVISKQRYDELAQAHPENEGDHKGTLREGERSGSLEWQVQIQRQLTLEDLDGIDFGSLPKSFRG